MKTLRIGVVTPAIRAEDEAFCIPAIDNLIAGLAARGHAVTVVTLRHPSHVRPYRLGAVTVHPVGAYLERGLRRIPLFARAIARLRRAGPFDVLHALWAHEPGAVAAAAALRARGRGRTPVLTSILGGELERFDALGYGGQRTAASRLMIERALAAADAVSVGSAWLAARVRRQTGGAVLPLVLPLGVDVARFAPCASDGDPSENAASAADDAPTLDGDPALLQVASLIPIKDQATLLRAFERVHRRRPGARLHLVGADTDLIPGRPPSGPRLTALARALGVADAVRLHGAVDHARLPALYRSADLFVLSSRFESQCMAALEAAACGARVVGTAVGVLPALGVPTARPGDAADLARAIDAGLRKPQPALTDAVRARFALDAALDRVERIYARLAATC
ncbi:MAG: glycosyltransferase [Acidobacteriota bacterium]